MGIIDNILAEKDEDQDPTLLAGNDGDDTSPDVADDDTDDSSDDSSPALQEQSSQLSSPTPPPATPAATPQFDIAAYSPEKRAALVKAVNDSGNPFAAALAGFGAGVSGGSVTNAFNSTINSGKAPEVAELQAFDRARGQGLQDTQIQKDQRNDQQAQAKLARESDPNSLESKTAQDLAVKLGMDPEQAKQLTAAKFKDFSPALEKSYQIAQRSADLKLKAQAQQDAKQVALHDKTSAADEKTLDRLSMNLKDDLDPDKARAGNLAANQKKVYQADRLSALVKDSNGNISNLDQRQIEELAIGANSLLSNSNTSAVSQVKALVPQTIVGDASKLKEWLTNDPTGTNQVAFVKKLSDTVDRERNVAVDQVKNAQVQRLSAYSKLRNGRPDEYNAIVSAYGINPSTDIDANGKYVPQVRGQADASTPKLVTVTQNGQTFQVPEDQVRKQASPGGN